MQAEKKSALLGFGAGIAITLFTAFLIGLFVAYTGSYNIAATEDHSPLVRWGFTTTMKNSVASRANDLPAAPEITEAMLVQGASEYQAMCQHCHGGVGTERESWAEGMLPEPPHLQEAAAEWELNEIFWLVKHGVKMAGMPAFGPSHEDETLRAIAAFVSRLPSMTEEKYNSYTENQSSEQSGHSADNHSH